MAASNRFVFNPYTVQSAGDPVVYNVLEVPGGNRRIGRVFFDFVMQRWAFILETHYNHMSQPGVEIGSADAQEIKDFIGTLAGVSNLRTPPND